MIVPHDVVHVYRPGDVLPLIQFAGVAPEVGKIHHPVAVALEMQVIDAVEAQQRHEQAPIGLGDPVAHQVSRF
jgi:hypothetical protein